MCGIVGYIGNDRALNILLNGLNALEYRGYDSAGVSIKNKDGSLSTSKTKGKVIDLTSLIIENKTLLDGNLGIGHTRWATHGKPNTINAHPHTTGKISIVHNGIIENFRELDIFLKKHNRYKKSDTDSETIALLIDLFIENSTFLNAFKKAVGMLKGSFAIAAISAVSDEMLLAKRESPLIIGIAENAFYIASDIAAMLKYTDKFIYLEDGDIAQICENAVLFDNNDNIVKRDIKVIDWDMGSAKKGGYKHFMIKEIAEEADAVKNTIQPRIGENGDILIKEELSLDDNFIENIDRITIAACGTSYYASCVSKSIFERYAHIPVNVEIASEFRYSENLFSKNELFVVVSQSGETADTKACLKLAHEKGVRNLSVVNVKESAIARMSDDCLYTLAGPEISVASTKAFVSQLSALYMLAFYIAGVRGENTSALARTLRSIPNIMKKTFNELNEIMKEIAKKYANYKDFLYLGRNLMYPIALEGALKLKEISYIHAEGYPAGEIKHGPIALIDENIPTVILSPFNEPLYSKTLSNANEIKSRLGKIILLSDKESELSDDFIKMSSVDYIFSPFLYVMPLQLLAYYISLFLGNDIDQPRNLAKSVTVE